MPCAPQRTALQRWLGAPGSASPGLQPYTAEPWSRLRPCLRAPELPAVSPRGLFPPLALPSARLRDVSLEKHRPHPVIICFYIRFDSFACKIKFILCKETFKTSPKTCSQPTFPLSPKMPDTGLPTVPETQLCVSVCPPGRAPHHSPPLTHPFLIILGTSFSGKHSPDFPGKLISPFVMALQYCFRITSINCCC